MATKVLRPKTREEWLELRGEGIGSSEVATIMGLNPFDTPLKLWRRKKHIDPPIPENTAMMMGHLLEDAVAQRWMMETHHQIIKNSAVDFIMYDEEKPYMRVSPDRLYWLEGEKHNDRNRGIVECKTTALSVDYDNPPLHWFVQLQYQLGVSGYPEGWLAWLTKGRDFGCRYFEFDKEYFEEQITEAVTRFVTDNLQGNIEPQAYNAEDVLLLSPRSITGKSIAATPELLETIDHLKQLKKEMKEMDAVKTRLEEEIKMAMCDAESILDINGKALCTWKSRKDSLKFDEKALLKDLPELHERYQRTVPGSRTFLVK